MDDNVIAVDNNSVFSFLVSYDFDCLLVIFTSFERTIIMNTKMQFCFKYGCYFSLN